MLIDAQMAYIAQIKGQKNMALIGSIGQKDSLTLIFYLFVAYGHNGQRSRSMLTYENVENDLSIWV